LEAQIRYSTENSEEPEGGNAGDGTKAGPALACDWPGTPAAWEAGASGSDPSALPRNQGNDVLTGCTGFTGLRTDSDKRILLHILSILLILSKFFCRAGIGV
jgi:hypothetical protein